MKDPVVLAYVNMYAVLKCLEALCALDDDAKKLALPPKPLSIGLNVRGGPKATLRFDQGGCEMTPRMGGDIKLLLTSCQGFNQMVDGKQNPFPYWGFTKLSFLLNNFTQLTDLLGRYLRADPQALENRAFFEKSTTLMFYLVANALSAIGNHDPVGGIAAKAMPDGIIALEIENGPCAEIAVVGGRLSTRCHKAQNPRAYMIFRDFDTARGLFEGRVEAMGALAAGQIVMKGYIPLIDNLNKLLARVALYLG